MIERLSFRRVFTLVFFLMIFALAVRVYRLPREIELPMLADYGGCKSWIELKDEVPIEGAQPVLADGDFEANLTRFRAALSRQAKAAAVETMSTN